MKKFQISILLSFISICSLFYLNCNIKNIYIEATGKTKALFGLIELSYLDEKGCLGFLVLLSLILSIIAFRNDENKPLSSFAICLACFSMILIFVRIWKLML